MIGKIQRVSVLALLLAGLLAFTGCGGSAEKTENPAPKSDGSEDLKIDYRLDLAKEDQENNYFTFSGPIRYLAADKDQVDMVSGASKLGSTHIFHAYLYDVEGKNTMSGGLRGLFLFAVNPYSQIESDGLNAYKNSDGSIVIQYVHRGTAYKISTDKSGKLLFPDGGFFKRTIGYIEGAGPQVLSSDFSADGTSFSVNWDKVWDSKTPDGKKIGDTTRTTGKIGPDGASSDSMYFFDGKLDISLENNILKISGFLTAVKR